MNISLLIARWEEKKQSCNLVEQAIYDLCISDLKMMASGQLREPHRLDTRCPFKKHRDEFWKDVIENDPAYVEWLYENVQGFQLDEFAHAYLVEVQERGNNIYDDLKYER
jgi:hypothetical protein